MCEIKSTFPPSKKGLITSDVFSASLSMNEKSLNVVSNIWNHVKTLSIKLYLIDIFRHAVNLVGARHGEIFSQDHKR